jgi:hypothetical protein
MCCDEMNFLKILDTDQLFQKITTFTLVVFQQFLVNSAR